MRTRLAAAVLLACLAAAGQTILTVEQLVSFVRSSVVELHHPDKQIAAFLDKCKLKESLDDRTIEDLQGMGAGPRTLEALRKLRDESKALPAPVPQAPPPPPSPIPPPSSIEQAAILDEIRQKALNYSKSLPDFICTQVTRRYFDPSGLEFWRQEDTLTARLTYFEQKEDYKLFLVNNRYTDQAYQSLGGATSSGEFGSMLKQLFEPSSEARFEWSRWTTFHGKRHYVFAYRVRQANSQWTLDYDHKLQIIAGYRGEIFVDREKHEITRVSLEAENVPHDFPIQQARTVLDYDHAKIGDRDYLLPLRAEVRMRSDKLLTRNEVEFRMYRKFSAEASLKFDTETPAPLPEDKIKEQPAK
jgi:hypothetical protein